MLRTLKDIETYHVEASDGDIGRVFDFYFDDQRWAIRYLVVDTGGFWRGPHRVLISPIAFRQADWSTQRFHLALDRDKVKNSPSLDLDKPVSRQYERVYHRYYGWAPYWGFGGSGYWGPGTIPGALAGSTWKDEHDIKTDETADQHLRSAREVAGYQINGGSEVLGHIADFIVDDETWALRYLVIDTHKLWFGKKVLVAPSWADEISWSERTIFTALSRETIKNSPEWKADRAVNRDYEVRLYDYYGRPAYWLGANSAKEEAPVATLPSGEHATQ